MPDTILTHRDHIEVTDTNGLDVEPQLQHNLVAERCLKTNLATYLTNNSIEGFEVDELVVAVNALINGQDVEPRLLAFMREHASLFYLCTKEQRGTIQRPAHVGVREADVIRSKSIRSVMWAIDPLIGLREEILDVNPEFNLTDAVMQNLNALKDLATSLDLDDAAAGEMVVELVDLLRNKALAVKEGGVEALHTLLASIKAERANALAVDFGSIVANHWCPDVFEVLNLLLGDLRNFEGEEEKERAIKDAINAGGDSYRNVLMLAALRKTGVDMKPVTSATVLNLNDDQFGLGGRPYSAAEVFMYDSKEELADFPQASVNLKVEKVRLMKNFSQWASMAFSNQSWGKGDLPLPDAMTSGDLRLEEAINWEKPTVDDRRIVVL